MAMQCMVIVECISSGILYVDEIISRGYKPLVINYVASALGCVLFVVVFDIASKGIDVVQDYYITGFTAAMWFALVLLAIAMVCTLSVKNKIVRKE